MKFIFPGDCVNRIKFNKNTKCTKIMDKSTTFSSIEINSTVFCHFSQSAANFNMRVLRKRGWSRVRSSLTLRHVVSCLVYFLNRYVPVSPFRSRVFSFSFFSNNSLAPHDYRSIGIRVLRQPVLRAAFFATKKILYVSIRLDTLRNRTLYAEKWKQNNLTHIIA